MFIGTFCFRRAAACQGADSESLERNTSRDADKCGATEDRPNHVGGTHPRCPLPGTLREDHRRPRSCSTDRSPPSAHGEKVDAISSDRPAVRCSGSRHDLSPAKSALEREKKIRLTSGRQSLDERERRHACGHLPLLTLTWVFYLVFRKD